MLFLLLGLFKLVLIDEILDFLFFVHFQLKELLLFITSCLFNLS